MDNDSKTNKDGIYAEFFCVSNGIRYHFKTVPYTELMKGLTDGVISAFEHILTDKTEQSNEAEQEEE